MIHIVFGDSPAGSLKLVLKEMGVNKKENVISFSDIFSIGPIYHLHEESGMKSRFQWIEHCIDEYDEFPDYKQRFGKTINQIKSIHEGVHITIWTSDNAHEQTGLRFVMHLLKEKNIDITLINTTEAFEEHFQMKKGEYSPLYTGEIPPEKLQLMYEKRYGKLCTDHDREEVEKEWLSLSENQDALRIWRNGRIQSLPEDYYDELIINKSKKLHSKQQTKDFIKSARLIGEVLGHLDQYVGDEFLQYRLKKLIKARVFEWEGHYVRLASGALSATRFNEI